MPVPASLRVVSVKIPAAQWRALEALARTQGVGRSELLREFIDRGLRAAGSLAGTAAAGPDRGYQEGVRRGLHEFKLALSQVAQRLLKNGVHR